MPLAPSTEIVNDYNIPCLSQHQCGGGLVGVCTGTLLGKEGATFGPDVVSIKTSEGLGCDSVSGQEGKLERVRGVIGIT